MLGPFETSDSASKDQCWAHLDLSAASLELILGPFQAMGSVSDWAILGPFQAVGSVSEDSLLAHSRPSVARLILLDVNRPIALARQCILL